MKMTTCSIEDSGPQAGGSASARSSTLAGAASASKPASAPAAAPARSRSRRVNPPDDAPENTPRAVYPPARRAKPRAGFGRLGPWHGKDPARGGVYGGAGSNGRATYDQEDHAMRNLTITATSAALALALLSGCGGSGYG